MAEKQVEVPKELGEYSTENLLRELARRLQVGGKLDRQAIASLSAIRATLRPDLKVSPESEASKWAKVITNVGRGCVYGLQKLLYFSGKEITGVVGFHDEGFFGGMAEDQVFILPIYNFYNQLYGKVQEGTDYLVSSRVFNSRSEVGEGLKLPGGIGWRTFGYFFPLAKSCETKPREATPCLLGFFYLLPESQANQFLSAVKEDPDLMPAVFENIYPQAKQRGLKRLGADRLRIVQEVGVEPSGIQKFEELPYARPIQGETT